MKKYIIKYVERMHTEVGPGEFHYSYPARVSEYDNLSRAEYAYDSLSEDAAEEEAEITELTKNW